MDTDIRETEINPPMSYNTGGNTLKKHKSRYLEIECTTYIRISLLYFSYKHRFGFLFAIYIRLKYKLALMC